MSPTTPLADAHGRRITYLRLSITDRCNLRCRYCNVRGTFKWLPHEAILRREEILRMCRVLGRLGIRKVRLTGGEPLVRSDVVELVQGLRSIPDIERVSLTTNAVLLEDKAAPLYEAGLRHINISLDTLRPERFQALTGRDAHRRVVRGIRAAVRAGYHPVKVNAVVIRGTNDDEIRDLAALSLELPVQVRFIEFMPVGQDTGWSPDQLLSGEEIRREVERLTGPLAPVPRGRDAGPAAVFRAPGAPGEIGFISAMSRHFCADCNRVRITADGRLRLCLFSDEEIDVREALRGMDSDAALADFFREAVLRKPSGYAEQADPGQAPSCRRAMSAIGG
ncbi:GTP 3',8-cyclase MoaA [Dissulfurirhabdus thermomarina]|uniref:GTP 3',8-cyclase n=2 Tax=Dissulfurirhabdus thermomarina TaxID=1765737 RepID=A0A6N9TVR6_DISTH|nr:GTP 3',8-cyclase MoaA [Dissulfurirhabdus thermomarina]NDY42576.1 GTP 3',8-cyclase MoaA [Dissulfurirhabdus thermomarina]NMX22509.1 GTP 3',8-cyclase MoaA [Dissulfurirhabdus thermomarina]